MYSVGNLVAEIDGYGEPTGLAGPILEINKNQYVVEFFGEQFKLNSYQIVDIDNAILTLKSKQQLLTSKLDQLKLYKHSYQTETINIGSSQLFERH